MNAKWTAGGREKTTAVWVNDENGKTVCNVARCDDDWNRASLISAAPDLLAALEAIIKMIGPYAGQGRMDAEIAAARAAIAKARGE
jgi:hypothetical protein